MKKCLFLLLFIGVNAAFAQNVIIKSNDPHLRYEGRTGWRNGAAELSWPGNSVEINFSGTAISALLQDQTGTNYFKVIVDGRVMPDIQLDTTKHLYALATGLPNGKHHVELFKRTEWAFGKTWFWQFQLAPGSKVLDAPPAKKRKIEFYGNSITCGYAVLDTAGKDRGTAPFEDNYLSYAAITARHFNAEFSCIAKSGIGVLVSWFPLIMPEMYDRLDATDENSKWDFSKYTPQVVVINLFQNDSWIVTQPQNPEFKHRFGTTAPLGDRIIAAYQNMVANIRAKYPKAYIICALGNMDATRQGSAWPGYINAAVDNLHDRRIVTHFFPYKNTNGHPSKAEQQVMANDLIAFIEKNVKW